MRKFVAWCALLTLSACAPFGPQPTSQPVAVVPATYFPTSTPYPTWTPPPQPTATPLPPATPTSTLLPEPEPTLAPTNTPEPVVQPLPTQAPLPASAPTAPAEPLVLPTLAPTPVPLPTVTSAPQAAPQAFAAASISIASSCPTVSSGYDLVPFDGPAYKSNALTDFNADLRLSVIGLAPTDTPLTLVEYNGATDADPPKLYGLFEPNRPPAFARAYLRYEWLWNESQAEPYGSRGGLNTEWPASAVDLLTNPGEAIYPPERNSVIYGGGAIALVLFAGEQELTLSYTRGDSVGGGYVVHLLNLCVDPSLVTLYRAQLKDGRRATGQLPSVRNNQPIGTAIGAITVAVRDRASFLDPRSRKDWW